MPLLRSKPVPRDRCGDEMIENSAPHHWVEAHDQPSIGSEEIQKGAFGSLLTETQQQNPPEITATTPRNTHVINFHRNRSAHTLPRQLTHDNTARGPLEARASATQGRLAAVCRTNSRRRKAKGPAHNVCHKRHLKSLTG